MRKNVILAVLLLAAAVANGDEKTLQLTGRYRNEKETLEKQLAWEAPKTALIICDMWDQHWCKSASHRCGELAPRLNEMANALRSKGALIVHAPSDTMKAYEGTAGRKLAMSAPMAPEAKEIGRWRYIEKAKEG